VEVHAGTLPRAAWRERGARLTSPWAVAALVAVVYALLLGPGLVRNPHDYVNIGHKFIRMADTSTVIKPSLDSYSDHPIGYDGQFYYFLALDPKHGHDYMESPGTIYSRIGYPMTVRALSGGNAAVIPYMMVLVNIAAAVGGTLAVAFLLRRRGLSPALALLYGLFPGLVISVIRDLTEPLAFALAAAGLLAFDPRSNRRLLTSAALFALAILTRETVALFPAILTVALLVGIGPASRWRDRIRVGNVFRAGAFAIIAVAPLFAWRHVVAIWLSHPPIQEYPASGPAHGFIYALVPFHGLAAQWPWSADDISNILTTVLPGLIWATLAIKALRQRLSLEPWFVLANVLVFVVWLPTPVSVDYGSMGRAAIAIVLASLVALPQVKASLRGNTRGLHRALALWSLPYYLVIAITLTAVEALGG
jgi:hypothetical protein